MKFAKFFSRFFSAFRFVHVACVFAFRSAAMASPLVGSIGEFDKVPRRLLLLIMKDFNSISSRILSFGWSRGCFYCSEKEKSCRDDFDYTEARKHTEPFEIYSLCNFGAFLNLSLRDQSVCGIRNCSHSQKAFKRGSHLSTSHASGSCM